MPVVWGVTFKKRGGACSSKLVSTVSVVKHAKDLRVFKYSRTSWIFNFMQTRLNLEISERSAFAIASNSLFSSYVHLNVMLSVSFSLASPTKPLFQCVEY